MCVVQNYIQLAEAIRRETRELLVIGELARDLQVILTEANGNSCKNGCVQSFLKQIQICYTINYRKASCLVPLILHQNVRDYAKSEKGEGCGC